MDLFTTTAAGIEVQYAEQGSGDGLLLLHGWGAAHGLWRNLWPFVSSSFRCVAPDLPGWGASEKPDVPYTPEWYAGWLEAFMDARAMPTTAIVAHSMSTLAAMELALRSPQRVSRLVLVNPIADGSSAFAPAVKMLSGAMLSRVVRSFVWIRGVRRWLAKDFTHVMPLEDVDVDNVMRSTHASMVRPIHAMRAANVKSKLAGIRAATLVISSTHDRTVLGGQGGMIAGAIPHARYAEMQDVGHCPMLERPEEFNSTVSAFLREGRADHRPPQW